MDVDSFCLVIGRAVDDLFPVQRWHVAALGPMDSDEKWTVCVRTSTLVPSLFLLRSPRLISALFDLAAQVLSEAEKAQVDGAGLRELESIVNAVANSGDLARVA